GAALEEMLSGFDGGSILHDTINIRIFQSILAGFFFKCGSTWLGLVWQHNRPVGLRWRESLPAEAEWRLLHTVRLHNRYLIDNPVFQGNRECGRRATIFCFSGELEQISGHQVGFVKYTRSE